MFLLIKIRLGWKCLTVTNTLAYYGTESITVVKSFSVQAQGVSVIKTFFCVTDEQGK